MIKLYASWMASSYDSSVDKNISLKYAFLKKWLKPGKRHGKVQDESREFCDT